MLSRSTLHSRLRLFTFAAAFIAAPCALSAAPITVLNPSFEITTGMLPDNEFSFGVNPNWAEYDPNDIIGNSSGSNDIFLGTLEPGPLRVIFSTSRTGRRTDRDPVRIRQRSHPPRRTDRSA